MKKRELFELLNALQGVSDLQGVKFAYVVTKNMNKIRSEIKILQKSVKTPEKFSEYENKRMRICNKYCAKDKDNKPIIENNAYTGLDDNKFFSFEIDKLQKEYKETIDKRKKQAEEYKVMLEEETKVELYKVSLKNVPEKITAQQLEKIMPIVLEEK